MRLRVDADDKGEIQGFFAALRMTTPYELI
jgi:hypothetical protein